MLFVTAGLATVTARAAIVSSHQSFRNTNVKRAVQGASAGLRVVMYRMNLMQPAGDQCVLKGAGGVLTNGAVQNDGWCVPQTEDLGDNGAYSVQVSSAKLDERSGPGVRDPAR